MWVPKHCLHTGDFCGNHDSITAAPRVGVKVNTVGLGSAKWGCSYALRNDPFWNGGLCRLELGLGASRETKDS